MALLSAQNLVLRFGGPPLFDGASFAMDASGELRCQLPKFEEALEIVDGGTMSGPLAAEQPIEPGVYTGK